MLKIVQNETRMVKQFIACVQVTVCVCWEERGQERVRNREGDTQGDQVTAMSVSWLKSSGLFLIFQYKPLQDYPCYCFLIVIDIGQFYTHCLSVLFSSRAETAALNTLLKTDQIFCEWIKMFFRSRSLQ